jgi:selenium metabolism protein YedF
MSDKKELMLLVKSSAFGEGEPDLGEKLLKSFMQVLLDSGTMPDRMVFMNSGIFLTTAGSPIADIIREFESRGAEILSCKTCLDYFRRADQLIAGQPTNMKDTVDALLEFKKVIAV